MDATSHAWDEDDLLREMRDILPFGGGASARGIGGHGERALQTAGSAGVVSPALSGGAAEEAETHLLDVASFAQDGIARGVDGAYPSPLPGQEGWAILHLRAAVRLMVEHAWRPKPTLLRAVIDNVVPEGPHDVYTILPAQLVIACVAGGDYPSIPGAAGGHGLCRSLGDREGRTASWSAGDAEAKAVAVVEHVLADGSVRLLPLLAHALSLCPPGAEGAGGPSWEEDTRSAIVAYVRTCATVPSSPFSLQARVLLAHLCDAWGARASALPAELPIAATEAGDVADFEGLGIRLFGKLQVSPSPHATLAAPVALALPALCCWALLQTTTVPAVLRGGPLTFRPLHSAVWVSVAGSPEAAAGRGRWQLRSTMPCTPSRGTVRSSRAL